VHSRSNRAKAPFISVNCAAIPENLLESELFGHEKGAFTGAVARRIGKFEEATGGTLLLDEISEMTLRMQGLLLRFLETGEIQRIGDPRPAVWRDVRTVAATNVELEEAIAAGRFRRDLYYRLNVLRISVPPLRHRREDIPLLLDEFLSRAAAANEVPQPRVSPAALQILQEYDWPGNVREVRNIAERLVVCAATDPIEIDDLPVEVLRRLQGPAAIPRASFPADVMFERVVARRESFWAVVYDRFMAHDITRQDVRDIVRLGLERTHGSEALLSDLFGIEPADVRAFQSFLLKCRGPVPVGRAKLTARATAAAAI
jgi:transcriptional regulator with PAS, ATPase and Fis domain